MNRRDRSRATRVQGLFHLHGLDDCNQFALFDLLAFFDGDADNGRLDGGGDVRALVACPSAWAQ